MKKRERAQMDEMKWNQSSGAPRAANRPRQAHSSHLCFVGPHCAIKNKERDEMEEQIQLISSIFIHSPALRCPIQSKDFWIEWRRCCGRRKEMKFNGAESIVWIQCCSINFTFLLFNQLNQRKRRKLSFSLLFQYFLQSIVKLIGWFHNERKQSKWINKSN